MRLFGNNHWGPRKNTCKPRKRTKPTKNEKRLQWRIEAYNAMVRLKTHAENSVKRPGSLQAS